MNVCTINHKAIIPLCVLPEETSMETMMDIVIGVAYAANALFGLPSNGYVLWLIVRRRQQKIVSDFIPLNQIVVELLFCLSSILYFPYLCVSNRLITKLFNFLSLISLIMRPLVQSYICLEQHFATVHPVIFLRCKPLRYKVAICSACWLTAITLCVVLMAVNLPNTIFLIVAAFYLLCLLLMTFCCLSVLRALKRPAPGEGPRDGHRDNSMKERAFKIILVNLVYTSSFQLPMVVVLSLMGTMPCFSFITLSSVNTCAFVITGFIPPLLYLYRVGKLKQIYVYICNES